MQYNTDNKQISTAIESNGRIYYTDVHITYCLRLKILPKQ